ncbi:aldehyde dehydrogenase family protein [Corynebacterium sp. sy039]|uniref:aldehyde dehydrogenase family protein n=1 Tax=Corynebacterium sp. sy039 TaxID=2599641 RepID=UPI0011B45C07|nr:aldehyde dehydrogenase family protein [Corynebacterium sp. sy039]QDZ42487.1 aldehyde dehydrogenase family protein [Corynebacterium sp. sy039]
MNTKAYWVNLQSNLHFDGRPFINGQRIETDSKRTTEKINPANNEYIGSLSLSEASDINAAVVAARQAFSQGQWHTNGVTYRKELLTNLAALIDKNAEELALLDSLEMGKPIREAVTIDIPGAAALFRFYAEAIEKMEDSIPVTPPKATAQVTREALGVIGVIVPWNYPLEILTWKIAPALAVGNTVVVKPPLEASYSALRLAELATEAGFPPGVINVVPGTGEEAGQALSRHNDVDMIAFTGSTEVAKLLQIYAGESNLKRLALEAGGKSSNIIFADCEDLQLAAQKAAFGAFYNQGEVCSANSRIFVEEPIYEHFVEKFIEESKAYKPGDPLDPSCGTGSLVSQSHTQKVWSAIKSAQSDGTILAGGKRLQINGSDCYIEPTIIGNLPGDHFLHQTEIFGPVAIVSSFREEQDAIDAANATKYGLAASVWTNSLSKANRVSAVLNAGTVSVNTVDALSFTTPFGGFKQSGFGRDLSVHAFNNYTDLKTTWFQWG